jgi:hypothetical protein
MRSITTTASAALLICAVTLAYAGAAENAAPEWDPALNIPGVSQETAAEYPSEIAQPGELKASVLDDLPDRVITAASPVTLIRLRARPGPDGRCNEVEVVTSSGSPEIDNAAIRACRLEHTWDPPAAGTTPEWNDVEIVFHFLPAPFHTCCEVTGD